MAAPTVVRLAAAALAVVVVASCSGDDPEPVATRGGGIELASTTTEQPRITEPETTTTTERRSTTTTTSTTTTSTTTTTTAPQAPTVDQLSALLPAPDALPGGEWTRTEAPTEAGAPRPLCDGSTTATPLSGLLDEVAVAGGVSARYDRADGRSSLQLVVAPVPGAKAAVAAARDQVATCATAAPLEWPTLGEGSVAFAQPATTDAEGRTWAIVHVGDVAMGLSLRIFPADGVQAEPPPDDAALQAFLEAALTTLAAPPA
jgi:hypothetical protein